MRDSTSAEQNGTAASTFSINWGITVADNMEAERAAGKAAAQAIHIVAKVVEDRLAAGTRPEELVAELHQLAEVFDR